MVYNLSRNRLSFLEVCHGNFGRKVIYTDAETIDTSNAVKELGKALSTHFQNREEIDYLDRYLRGDQPINYRTKTIRQEINNKIVENHALEIVRFMTSQSFAEPIQYVCTVDDEAKTKMVDELNKYMAKINKPQCDVEIGEWKSICGTAYRFVWQESNDKKPIQIDSLDPRNVFIIYSSRNGRKPLMSVQSIKTSEGHNRYICYTDTEYFEIENSKIVAGSESSNGFLQIPVIEYPNNSRRLSDIEIVISSLDALNKIQSNRVDGIEQFVQSFMKFINCDIDKEKYEKMRELGAISVKIQQQGANADVDIISSELNQEQTQTAKEDLYNSILVTESMPSREKNTGGDTGSAVQKRNGWELAEQRAKLDEPIFKKSENQFLSILLYGLNIKKYGINLNEEEVDPKITRSKTDNMLVKSQTLLYLLEKGIYPKIAIETCDLWSDPEKVYIQSKDYLDAKYKTALELQEEADRQFAQQKELTTMNKPKEGEGNV